jgi:hypothetical protein
MGGARLYVSPIDFKGVQENVLDRPLVNHIDRANWGIDVKALPLGQTMQS